MPVQPGGGSLDLRFPYPVDSRLYSSHVSSGESSLLALYAFASDLRPPPHLVPIDRLLPPEGQSLRLLDFHHQGFAAGAQALGLHTASTAAYPLEDPHRVARLFWSVYSLERGVSLRLARSSTIRDHSITIPRPGPQPVAGVTIGYSLADMVNAARIYALIYDEIYSPKALAQPKQTRTAYVHALASEWRESIANRAQHIVRPYDYLTYLYPRLTHRRKSWQTDSRRRHMNSPWLTLQDTPLLSGTTSSSRPSTEPYPAEHHPRSPPSARRPPGLPCGNTPT